MLIDISHTAIHGCFKQLDYDLDLNLSPFSRNAGVITPKSIMEATYGLVHCITPALRSAPVLRRYEIPLHAELTNMRFLRLA